MLGPRFDDRRVLERIAVIGLGLALACAPVVQPSKTATPEEPIASEPIASGPIASEPIASQPEPEAIVAEPVGPPAPWLDDEGLRARILAVQAIVEAAAAAHEVEPALIYGLIYVESKFEPKAKGGDAQGLMQLMPKTAASLAKQLDRKRQSYDPEFNVQAGTLLLSGLLARFDGDVELALAAYNRGTGIVAGWVRDNEPMPERTQKFVDRVLRARAWFLESPPH